MNIEFPACESPNIEKYIYILRNENIEKEDAVVFQFEMNEASRQIIISLCSIIYKKKRD